MSGTQLALDLAERIGKRGADAINWTSAKGAAVGGIVSLIIFAPVIFAALLATIPLILAFVFLRWVGGDD